MRRALARVRASASHWLRELRPRHLTALAMGAVILLLLDEFSGITRPFERLMYLAGRGPLHMLVYAVVAVCLATVSVLLLRARSWTVSMVTLAIFMLGTCVELAYNIFTGTGFSEDMVAISLRELRMAPSAVRTYVDARVYLTFLLVLVSWTAFYVVVRRRRVFGALVPNAVALPLLGVLLVFSMGWRARFEHFRMYPVFLRPVFNVTDYYIQERFVPERVTPEIRLRDRPVVAQRVVFIVDESVRPDYLGLNGFRKPTTPYLSSIAGRLVNFGTASSGSTCSHASNVMLNSFVRTSDTQDRHAMLTRPTIFHFAKRAGYRTVFISAVFRSPLFYGIRKSDLEDIDDVVMINLLYDGQKYLNDHRLVEELAKVYAKYEAERVFIYMRKQGTHFPYDDYYEESHRPFTPILGSHRPMSAHKDKALNSYLNGVAWNLDSFYRVLDSTVGDVEAVYLYTSDHGETIERATEGLLHCGDDRTMAMVPLWLDVRGRETRTRLRAVFGEDLGRQNKDHASHMNIFPTLLSLMNVETDELTLFDDLTKQVRHFHPVGIRGTYRSVPFDARP